MSAADDTRLARFAEAVACGCGPTPEDHSDKMCLHDCCNVIADNVILLSEESFNKLLEELDRPAKVIPELRELLEKQTPWS